MTQEYYYPSNQCDKHEQPQEKVPEVLTTGKPIEVTFQFPKEPTSVISKMVVTLDDKTVEARVMEKEKSNIINYIHYI